MLSNFDWSIGGNLSIVDKHLSSKKKYIKNSENKEEQEEKFLYIYRENIWEISIYSIYEKDFYAIYLNPPWYQQNSIEKFVCAKKLFLLIFLLIHT